jgi:Arc/MetJ-type ribon-helix-helix transcriptional regulator
MRATRTWTISMPPALSRLAAQLADEEHRTKSELVREALRFYLTQRDRPIAAGASRRLARVGELADVYRQRAAARQPTEAELRRMFKGVRKTHERLQGLDL